MKIEKLPQGQRFIRMAAKRVFVYKDPAMAENSAGKARWRGIQHDEIEFGRSEGRGKPVEKIELVFSQALRVPHEDRDVHVAEGLHATRGQPAEQVPEENIRILKEHFCHMRNSGQDIGWEPLEFLHGTRTRARTAVTENRLEASIGESLPGFNVRRNPAAR